MESSTRVLEAPPKRERAFERPVTTPPSRGLPRERPARPDEPRLAPTGFFRRLGGDRAASAALLLLFLIAFGSAAAPLLSPSSPDAIAPNEKLEPPSAGHPFGTDDLGRDLFVRVLEGGRVSISVGMTAVVITLFIGVAGGAVAGFYGGIAGSLVMRFADVMLSIPVFLIILLSTSILSPGFVLLCCLIGSVQWMEVARVVRASVISTSALEFVSAARALGVPRARILFRHVLPHAGGPILVSATLGLAQAIVIESTLSFFGFGLQPPAVSWGSLLKDAQSHLATAPWVALFPGIMIIATVLSCYVLGEFLRSILAPGKTAGSPRVRG
ncbi:MAG: peptide transporter permease [Candidatus Krumholzibacteriota bacterium]|nr:peptide transporter permease [Candidatus Krumholzibacteriota bacterium]